MTKAEIAKILTERIPGLGRGQAIDAINIIYETIIDSVTHGEPVTIRGFGTFTKKHRAAKPARIVSKNEKIMVEEHDKPCFKPSAEFCDLVRYPKHTVKL